MKSPKTLTVPPNIYPEMITLKAYIDEEYTPPENCFCFPCPSRWGQAPHKPAERTPGGPRPVAQGLEYRDEQIHQRGDHRLNDRPQPAGRTVRCGEDFLYRCQSVLDDFDGGSRSYSRIPLTSD
jgi:hypothetical protein